ncbi:MAG: hypothetical protein HY462_01895 [Parcubacteria group bacterium]|nr:hypothetical protein [Parcubacteria group bacterium]
MIGALKHVTIWAAPEKFAAMERLGAVWFAEFDGECAFLLESWKEASYDPSVVVQELALIESLDLETTTFFELCTPLVYPDIPPSEAKCRRLVMEDGEVVRFVWERCCRELEYLFISYLVAREARGGAREVALALEFREVAYPNPEFPREGPEFQHALYAMCGSHICVYAGCADAHFPTRGEAPIIITTILEQERMDPAETVFYDLAPDGSWCTRICALPSGDELVYEMTEVTPDAAIAEQFKRELAAWSANGALEKSEE